MTSFTAFIAQNAGLIALPFYFHALGYAADRNRLLDDAVSGRFGADGACSPAGSPTAIMPASSAPSASAIFAASMALLALLPAHPATFDVVWRTALGGVGFAHLRRAEFARDGRRRAAAPQRCDHRPDDDARA